MTITFVPPPVDAKRIIDRDLAIGQLCLSEHNCRQSEPDADDTAPLEALILLQGLRVPIEVHALAPPDGDPTGAIAYGAFAGRRRFFSIKRLIERGDLPADSVFQAREYIGYSDAELVELSLSENFRKDLADHELFAGIARANELGHDVELIAKNIGFADAELVARWVRLGSLAPEVFEALTTGEIDVPRAKAYAATEDRELQAATYKALRRGPGLVQTTPTEIRKALKVGDRELERRLAFVGADAYQAAGGRYELNLFAEDPDQRGRVVDEGILAELVADKQDQIRTQVRADTATPNLRFVAELPQNGIGSTDFTLRHFPKDGDDARLPDGVVAHLKLGEDGQAEVTFWWASASAKHGSARSAPAQTRTGPGRSMTDVFSRPAEGAALNGEQGGFGELKRAANAELKDKAGLTADLVEILRSQRRLILRAALIDVARTYDVDHSPADIFSTWAQLRLRINQDRVSMIGAGAIAAIGDPPIAVEHLLAMPAYRVWSLALQEISSHPALAELDPAPGYAAYRAARPALHALAGAVLTALSIERSMDADGYRIAVHDALATELGLTRPEILRRYWTPTAELLGKLDKSSRVAIAEPFVEAAVSADWPRLKDPQLTENVLQVVTGKHRAIRPALADQAATWVHPQLLFRAVDGNFVRYLEDLPVPAAAERQPEVVS